jgi:membrane protein
VKRFLVKLDCWQRAHRWLAFPFAVVKKFGEDQAGNLAALVAYYAIFSIFPLLLVLSTVLGFVLQGHPDWQDAVTKSALRNLPLVNMQTRNTSGSVSALVIGSALALWSGLGVAKTAQTAFNTVYVVPHTDRPNFLKATLRSLAIVVVGGLGLILTTGLSSAVTSVTHIGSLDVGPGLRVVGVVLAIAFNALLFLVLFRWLTVREVRWRDAWPGALISAAALQVLQLSASALIAHKLKGASTTYGKDIASVIVLLSWFYLQAQVLLLAAEVNVVRQYKLWPRALTDAPATPADYRAYESYAEREQYQSGEEIETDFGGQDKSEGPPTTGTTGLRSSRTTTARAHAPRQPAGPSDPA